MKKILFLLFSISSILACQSKDKTATQDTDSQPRMTEAEILLKQAIIAHGGELYDQAHYQFTFRDKLYRFHHSDEGYVYMVTFQKDGQEIVDHLKNGAFSRTIDGVEQNLTDKEENRYRESLNSVIYFATLPYKLSDPAVNLSMQEETTIGDMQYDVLKVTFDQEGGGKDFEDQFHYWINKSGHTIDYLAYNYKTNKGGVRFRSAYNRRIVEGIIFQDYINFKAEVGTPLDALPSLYEEGILEELSKIETESVQKLD